MQVVGGGKSEDVREKRLTKCSQIDPAKFSKVKA